MTNMLKDLFNYFFFPKHKYKPVPRQIINEFDNRKVTEDEQLLMMKNKARSPMAARAIMRRYKVDSAAAALNVIPPRRYTTPQERLIRLIQKMAGHDERDPYRVSEVVKNRMD